MNYWDRELRKALAEHVRETVRFSRNVNHSMERLWVYVGEHNRYKRFRINDPAAIQRTYADEAGIDRTRQEQVLQRFTTVRRFLSFQSLPAPTKRAWARGYETPLRTVSPKLIRALKRKVRDGDEGIDIGELVKSPKLSSARTGSRQCLPKHALH